MADNFASFLQKLKPPTLERTVEFVSAVLLSIDDGKSTLLNLNRDGNVVCGMWCTLLLISELYNQRPKATK
jgi:hypothetical protein